MAARALLLLHEKVVRTDGSLVEIVIWRLPRPTPDRPHGLKYRLYFGRAGECLVRYDNEAGKGDQARLRRDFEADIRRYGGQHEKNP